MISQRDINAFFTVLGVLSDPEKARAELKVLSDMRASVDVDLQRVGEQSQQAQNMLSDARSMMTSAKELERAAMERDQINAELAKALAAKGTEQLKVAEDQQKINKLLDEREAVVKQWEEDLAKKISRYETSYADYLVRNEALRKNEAEYKERLNKLKQIAN